MTDSCWSYLGDVDVSPLLTWLQGGNAKWPPVKGGQPNRVHAPAEALPIITTVLGWFDGPVTYDSYYASVSRLIPGQGHDYHQDPQQPNWITRIHVPVITNPLAWIAFEEEDGRHVHFEAGKAYSFNTLKRHAFANDGLTDRVHLLFDVLRP